MLKNATKVSLAMLSLGVALNAQAQDKKEILKPLPLRQRLWSLQKLMLLNLTKPYKEVITDKAKLLKACLQFIKLKISITSKFLIH
jgi:hypothetical protein